MSFEQGYMKLLEDVQQYGEMRPSRAGNTIGVFGAKLEIASLAFGDFPLLTARKMFYKPVLGELAAFLLGATDVAVFKMFGCNYWDANAAVWSGNLGCPVEEHEVGQIYGAKWRDFHGVDQIRKLVDGINSDPHSRRHLITAYDPSETYQCLPPCHLMAQFSVRSDNSLDCIVYMRSVDLCLGLPSDVILYAALLILVAKETDCSCGVLTFMFGDAHIYENHQIGRAHV